MRGLQASPPERREKGRSGGGRVPRGAAGVAQGGRGGEVLLYLGWEGSGREEPHWGIPGVCRAEAAGPTCSSLFLTSGVA